MLLNASSPYRRTGVLHEAYARYYGRDDARVLVWQAPTLAMNMTLDPAVVERAFEDGPVIRLAEFGAEFRTDMAIAHSEDNIPTLDAIRERRPPFSPDAVVGEFSGACKAYRISKAEADKWGGDWVGEAFRKNGITVTPSAKPKSELYVETLPMLDAGRCALLDHPRLVSQLCGLERRTSPRRPGLASITRRAPTTSLAMRWRARYCW